MSSWLIRQGYGFGAARIPLGADPHLSWGEAWSLREAAVQARPYLREKRGILSLLPAATMGFVIAIAPLLALLHRDVDFSDIDLVLVQAAATEVPAPPAAVARPAPPPEVVRKPEPPPPPPPVAEPAPVVVAVTAPPVPVPVAEPRRAPPKPEPAPAAKAPPRVEMAPLAAPQPPPQVVAVATPSPRRPAPVPAAPTFAPAIAIDAVSRPALRSTRSPSAGRSAAPPAAPSRPSRPVPQLGAVAGLPAPADTETAPVSRRAPAPRPQAASRPAASPRRPASIALPGAAKVVAAAAPTTRPKSERRGPKVVTVAPRAGQARPGLAGVPLASLASCVSDREEHALKQRVLAAVGGRGECRSGAGRYVFVEARNLNAFLMYVERPATRAGADRCVELTFALDCLTQESGKPTGRV